jgi:hypothetical protein
MDHDNSGMDQMMADNVVEEVIAPGNQEEGYLSGDGLGGLEGQDISQQFIHQVFNPQTGTFNQVQDPLTQQAKARRPVQKVQQQVCANILIYSLSNYFNYFPVSGQVRVITAFSRRTKSTNCTRRKFPTRAYSRRNFDC